MEEVDKGCSMIRMGVCGQMIFLVPAHPGSPGKGPLNGCVCHSQYFDAAEQASRTV